MKGVPQGRYTREFRQEAIVLDPGANRLSDIKL